MSHFVADIGNTSVKTALMSDGRVTVMSRGAALDPEVCSIAYGGDVSMGILSSVRELTPDEEKVMASLGFPVLRLSCDTHIPLRILYSTPHTLGPDRIAAAVGAWCRMPGRNLLIIDAGTAITYDVVTAQGEYIGGNISPGCNLRFRSLAEHTGRLPLVGPDGDIPDTGYSTETAIRSGVMLGILNEVSGYVERLSQIYDSLFVFLTGGDADLFEIPIKSGIFADEFLVLEGLDSICNFNEKG